MKFTSAVCLLQVSRLCVALLHLFHPHWHGIDELKHLISKWRRGVLLLDGSIFANEDSAMTKPHHVGCKGAHVCSKVDDMAEGWRALLRVQIENEKMAFDCIGGI